jgi:hypothetical protein
MHGAVKAEAAAVHALGVAVSRYAEHVRSAAASARAAARDTEARTQEIAEQRRQELKRANRALARAQAALAECRRGCGPLVDAVANAQQAQQHAEHGYQQAIKAAEITRATARELSVVISAVESIVTGQSSTAVAALADLEERLRQLTGSGQTRWLQNTLSGIGIAVNVARGVSVGEALTRPYIAPHRDDVTIAQQLEENAAELQQQWLGNEEKRHWDQENVDRSKAFP